ncbi:MAG: PorT family protein [Bacteroidales bacterium]|nr:PorT family protein [Bacteroidales bacterium]MBN2819544.1 PorT family protein [Bacteroidales bacterium]
MKIRILIISAIIFFSLTIKAQRFQGGVLAGINACQIDGDNWSGFNKLGLNFGAFVNTKFNDEWGGQLEIKYSGKGSSSGPFSTEPQLVSLRYIDIPILATYEIKKDLKIQGGISINYLFSGMYYAGEWFDDWDYPPTKYETAITCGVNYRYFESFDFNLRYSYSIMPVRTAYSTSSWGEGAWFNNYLTFALYFEIGSNGF